MLQVTDLKMTYAPRLSVPVEALKGVDFSMEEGEFVAIMGESGSGKSTLLNLIALLDEPTSGTICLDGEDITHYSDKQRSLYRREHMGYIFQDYSLLDIFTIEENVALPLLLSGTSSPLARQKAKEKLESLGILDLSGKYPYELSGGQQQRAAVARALVISPRLILADEPTGALDSKMAMSLLDTFSTLKEQGQSILMVTHSSHAASYASRVLFLKDGRIYHQIYRGDLKQEDFHRDIIHSLSVLGGAQ